MRCLIRAEGIVHAVKTENGEIAALKGINIDIPKGKLTVIKGEADVSKSLLLCILGALDKPKEGKVLYDGANIAKASERKRARMRRTRMGFVLRSDGLMPSMTVLENMEYALKIAGYRGKHTERAVQCLRMAELSERAHCLIEELSDEDRRIAAAARAMVHNPEVVFVDAPSGEMDAQSERRLAELFRRFSTEDSATVVMMLRSEEAAAQGDVIYEMKDEKILLGK